ncbi:MAG: hypothetical protein NC931_06720 [Candidatus Omnitrophica bacterium]|nr:hypothetical protein [Candidatus Omnitrophota bacterium]MCM8821342.1 hypothetical protein [Candidatus Omnitrophota bacterium]MCM8828770.1 hypothetical protein [Candidatus Omnitrophota bacterium]
MVTDVDEPIKVKVIIGNGTIRIISLFWNNRVIPVENITYRWVTKAGIYPVFHFAVLCGTSIMEIHFNPVKLQWKLDRIHMEG